MTEYALNPQASELLALWGDGGGALAKVITEVSNTPAGRRLANTLSDLSAQLWQAYTRPVDGASGDPSEPNTEAWRRQANRDAFANVLTALNTPNLPDGGMLLTSCVPVTEAAHRVGRALHELGLPQVSAAIEAEVTVELAAVTSAELGDLSGRAAQAVVLSRADASPTQVQAAWALLAGGPTEPDVSKLHLIDPTAAALVAAEWLRGAAMVACAGSEVSWVQAVQEADNIEAVAYETPTFVLHALQDGSSSREVVTTLVRNALAVADGQIPDLTALLERVEEAQVQAAGRATPGLRLEDFLPARLTPLDPHRPALDLLEDLIGGIEACFLLWCAHHQDEGPFDVDEDDEDSWAENTSADVSRFDAAVAAQMADVDPTRL